METDSEDGSQILHEEIGTSLLDHSIKTQTIMRCEIVNLSSCYNLEIYLLSSGILLFRTRNNFLNGKERCMTRKHSKIFFSVTLMFLIPRQ
jgi:hypothetical protein